MTREDIIRMAREAGGLPDPMVFIGAYERFAALVAASAKAEEREECAKLAENARELGLDYEPPCKTGSQCTNKCQQCEQPAQPSKLWVGLSNDEIYDMYNEPRSDAEMVEFAHAIEAKLKEKNT